MNATHPSLFGDIRHFMENNFCCLARSDHLQIHGGGVEVNLQFLIFLFMFLLQGDIAASGRTLPMCRSKPSGPHCCACTTLTWWTDTSPPSTTPLWYTRPTIPSLHTKEGNTEDFHANSFGAVINRAAFSEPGKFQITTGKTAIYEPILWDHF